MAETGHLVIPPDTIKNLRTDLVLDDGTALSLDDGKYYYVQNKSENHVNIAQRLNTRGTPTLQSKDCQIIGNLLEDSWIQVKVEADSNYYVWSLKHGAEIAVTEIQ